MRTIVASAMVWLAVFAADTVAKAPGEVAINGVLPQASLHGLGGPSRNLSDFRGKPLIINVWASWCGPCRNEMASLERLSRRYGKNGFQVIGISTDDYPDAAMDFLRKAKTTFNHYIDYQLSMEHMLGADRIPLTVLLDGKGRIITKIYGAREWDSPESLRIIGNAFEITM